nr:protein NRT1/ PTR FAMILY 5.14-like [Quercus suber]
MSGGCLSTIRCAVKDWYNYYIYFSTAALFISGLVLSHSFVEYAVVSTLIDYLTGNWKKQHLPKAVAIINLQDGVATVLAVVLAHVADSCIGRVNMIVFTTISYVSGLVLLWWSTKFLGPIGEIVTFYVAAVMLAVGMSGREPPLKAFLADQLSKKENPNEEEPEQIEGRTKVWWRIARFSGATIALFCLPNTSWEKAFKVSALVMVANLLLFLFGYGISAYGLSFYGLPCYNILEPTGSPLRIIPGVVKLAINNRHCNYPRTEKGFYWKNHTPSQFEENRGQIHLSPKVLFLG